MPTALKSMITGLVSGIEPTDDLGREHRRNALSWLAGTDDIFRRVKPITPSPHLVSYFLLVDRAAGSVLLCDHRLSGLWLPTGGHVEPGEHPLDTVRREAVEELGATAQLDAVLQDKPFFLTMTKTVGPPAMRHVDVSLWFALAGRAGQALYPDQREFIRVSGRARSWPRPLIASKTVVFIAVDTIAALIDDPAPTVRPRLTIEAVDYPGFGHSDAPAPAEFAYTFDHLAAVTGRFTEVRGLRRYTLAVQDYGGPVGFRLAIAHPGRLGALIVQNAVAHEDGLGPLWQTRREFWADRQAHEAALRENFFSLAATRQRHVGTSPNAETYDPDLWTDEFAFLSRPGQHDIQADLFYDYRTNVASYPAWQHWLPRLGAVRPGRASRCDGSSRGGAESEPYFEKYWNIGT